MARRLFLCLGLVAVMLLTVSPAMAGTAQVTEATSVPPHWENHEDLNSNYTSLGLSDGDALRSLPMARMMADTFDGYLGTRWRTAHGSYYQCASNLTGQDNADVCALHRAGVIRPIPTLENGQWVWDDTKIFTRYELAEYTYKILNFINSHNGDSDSGETFRMGTDSPLDGYHMDDRVVSSNNTIGSRTDVRAAYWDVQSDIDNGFVTQSQAQYVAWMSQPGIRVFEPCDGLPKWNKFVYISGFNAKSVKACGMSSATNDEAKLYLARLFMSAQGKPSDDWTAWYMELPPNAWEQYWSAIGWPYGGPLGDFEFFDGYRTHDVKDCAGLENSGPQASDYDGYTGSYTPVNQSYWAHTGWWDHPNPSEGRHFPASVELHDWLGWDGSGERVSSSSVLYGTYGDCR